MHDLIKKAMAFALKAHNVQSYGGIYPYHKHCEDVHNVLVRFEFTEKDDLDLLISAWLHDVIEDTATSFNDVKKEFGEDIAEIVFCVTDEMGRNRKEKKEKTYPKIRSNPKSVILKVADRIANAEFSMKQKSPQAEMYKKEFTEFQYNLRIHQQIDEMWIHLEKVLFREILLPPLYGGYKGCDCSLKSADCAFGDLRGSQSCLDLLRREYATGKY